MPNSLVSLQVGIPCGFNVLPALRGLGWLARATRF